MHVAVKRSIVAAAAVAAAGLYGSLSYDGAVVAQQGVPTVHRDVALVDVDVDDTALAASTAAQQTAFLTAENTFNTEAYGAFFNPTTGFEAELYNGLGANANLLLDTTSASGIFDGATSQYLDGVYADGLLGEDFLNQALGISATTSEADIVTQLTGADPFVAVTTAEGTEITALESATTSSTFDGDLAGLAQAFYTQSFTDLTGYETYLSDNATALTTADFSLSTVLSDVTTDLSNGMSGLSSDLTTFITALDTIAGI